MKSMKKAISLLLALVMCLGMLPMSAFAADVPEHEHNQNGWQCVYTEPVTETDCTHQHDGTCGYAAPTEGSSCTHEHNADCGYAAAVEGVACTCGAQPDENGVVTHTDDCAYVEAKAEVPCKHQHNETCGYVEAKAEVPCTHVCSKESGCVTVVTEGYWTCTAPVAEEVPAEVQAFLSAVAALPGASQVTAENAEAVGAQVNAVLDMYEGLVDASLDGREDVAGALTTVYAVYEAVLAAEKISSDTYKSTGQSAIGYWCPGANSTSNRGYAKYLHNYDPWVGEVFYKAAYTNYIGHNFKYPDGSFTLDGEIGDKLVDSGPIGIWSKPLNSVNYTSGTYGYACKFNYVKVNGTPVANGGSVDLENTRVVVSWDAESKSESNPPKIRAEFIQLTEGASSDYVDIEVGFDYWISQNGGEGSTGHYTHFIYNAANKNNQKPSKPSDAELSDLQVMVSCVDQNGNTNGACYGMTRGLTAYKGNYTVSDVVKNPGTKYSSSSYPYMCTITLDNEAWLSTFAQILQTQMGITTPHYVHSKTGTVTKELYCDKSGTWNYELPKTMYVYVTETAPAPTPTTYRIFCEYYINGELIATVKGGEESGTVGQKLVGQTIADDNPSWKNRKVDEETHTFTYAGSYEGSCDANNKVTVGAKADSVTLTANTSTNVIVLRYEENTPVTYTVQWLDADGSPIKAEATRTGNVGETVSVTDADKTVTDYTFAKDDKRNVTSAPLAATGTVLKLYFTKNAPVDNGNGIEVTKTRTSAATAKVGDTITWNITVTNKSNVTKTVTLTEQTGVTLSKTSVTLEAGESETVTATYVVQAADAGKTFTNTVKAKVPDSTEPKDKDEATDGGTTITPDEHTVTVNYVTDGDAKLGSITYTLADDEAYNHSVGSGTTAPTTGDANTESPKTITGTDGKTYAYDPVLTTNALTGTMGSTDVTITVVYSLDEKGTIGTDPDGNPTDTPDDIPDKYQVKVTFEVKNGKWNDKSTDDVVKYLVKYTGTVMDVDGTAALGDIIPAVGSKPGQDYKEGYDANNWSQNEPTATTTIGTDTTYTYTYVPDTTADDGKGISITKTRVSIGGDASATVAEPGDVIKWEITVTNLSNVEKTVTLTEGLDGARLSVSSITLAPAGQEDASKIVTATYTVAKADVGSTLVNTVVAKTDSPDDGEKEAKDPGTPILSDKVVKMAIKNRFGAQNGDIIPYTVTVQNNSGFSLYGLDIMDDLNTHVYGVDANGTFVRDINTVTLTVVNVKATVGGKEVTLVPDSKNTDANAVNGTTSRKWTVLNRNTPMENGVPVVLTYDVKVAFTAGDYSGIANDGLRVDLKATASYGNWNSPATPATTARLMNSWEAPRYFGLAGMFAYDNQGSSDASSGTPDGTDPGQSGDGDGTNSDSSTAEGNGSFTIPGGGGGTEQPDQPDPPVDPNPPVDPDPYEPIIPDEPTPVAPNPPEVEIDDERTPLASANGLNSVDHFAYIIGYDDDTVRPENKITRAEVATIFFRLMTDVYRAANWSTTNDFSDVAAGSWYNNAISTCAKAGLVNGYSDGTFKPDQSITRAEFATIAARFLDEEITGAGAEGFADIEGHWAETNILRAAEAGWVNGDNGRFRPDDYISRAEVMTIVNRMLNRVPDADHMLPEMKTWSDNPKTAWYYEAVQEATNEHAYEWIDENVENWTELLTIRDWAALEKEWATAYSAGN